nr:hypothetical protein [Kribbella jiaozuonensis]
MPSTDVMILGQDAVVGGATDGIAQRRVGGEDFPQALVGVRSRRESVGVLTDECTEGVIEVLVRGFSGYAEHVVRI